MQKPDAATAIVLGAGFSKCSDLPLTGELSLALLDPAFRTSTDYVITAAIRSFLGYVFGWRDGMPIPSLEDVFTLIDLSANSGHNLGPSFAPRKLRALRRMLIYRVFSILDMRFRYSTAIASLLDYYLADNAVRLAGFVVLNWDIVLEQHLHRFNHIRVDYRVAAEPWYSEQSAVGIPVNVAKIHGSSNWVYCDNCRAVFYDLTSKLSLAIRAGIVKTDFRLFASKVNKQGRRPLRDVGFNTTANHCRRCQVAVGPHIATFSYRKSFRTQVFSSSWLAAEQVLSTASKWVFIGYSLPAADFEFRHLLKTCELKQRRSLEVTKQVSTVLLDDTVAEQAYRRFFGSVAVYQGGLAEYTAALK